KNQENEYTPPKETDPARRQGRHRESSSQKNARRRRLKETWPRAGHTNRWKRALRPRRQRMPATSHCRPRAPRRRESKKSPPPPSRQYRSKRQQPGRCVPRERQTRCWKAWQEAWVRSWLDFRVSIADNVPESDTIIGLVAGIAMWQNAVKSRWRCAGWRPESRLTSLQPWSTTPSTVSA